MSIGAFTVKRFASKICHSNTNRYFSTSDKGRSRPSLNWLTIGTSSARLPRHVEAIDEASARSARGLNPI